MRTREVKPNQWKMFCQRITETHHGAMVNIQLIHKDSSATTVAEELPFQKLSLDERRDACNDVLVVKAGLPNEKPIQYHIIEPIELLLRDGNDLRYNQLQIKAENGISILIFHPGFTPDLLAAVEVE
jgi:hypothetical protein